ncbi:deleted in malignant brain tumors 1 protein-like [Anneissia japonica]|uniref:deleted in malignant brain tumors 1 protein-like n=1 Tax=Anneissia japonica TaxID=1529436 RepID=UPI0014257725|nr:deleted in malignant brain tumors 1 protein-like [Anneissia japonica]
MLLTSLKLHILLSFYIVTILIEEKCFSAEVRLVGGSNNNKGRVEVYVEGEWGTICDDWWDINDARVVCRQLGFSDAIDAPQSAHFGEGSGDIMYDDVACTGNESDITSCPNRGLRSHDCGHHEDASVICSSKVRLVGGSNSNEGRVEVYVEGEWGTICDDLLDITDARVVCRQLGFPDAIDAPQSAHFGEGSGDIMYDDVACTGNESDITSCPNRGLRSHDCGHHEDASVICTSKVRLVGGSNNNKGRVEVYVEGEWGTICDDWWDINDARVVCRQLGFSDAIDAPQSAHFGEGSGDIMYDDVACTGNESDITSCPNRGLRSHDCGHHEDASVICTSKVRLVGGSNSNEGRVEVYVEGEWGTICDDLWDITDARVICRQVGFPDAIDAPPSAHFGEGCGDIMYDDVACTGNESDITHCPNRGLRSHDCGHHEDASVICTSSYMTTTGYMPSTGAQTFTPTACGVLHTNNTELKDYGGDFKINTKLRNKNLQNIRKECPDSIVKGQQNYQLFIDCQKCCHSSSFLQKLWI